MKSFNITLTFKTVLFVSLMIGAGHLGAQERRSGMLNANEQSIGLATGMDYSILPVDITYKRGFKFLDSQYALNAGVQITIPSFQFDLNDVRIRLISEATLLRKGNYEIRGGIEPVLVSTKLQTENMVSIGADFHLFTGITNEKWNIGLDLNYNQIFSTHIKHTEKYRTNVFEDAVDGWYKSTASNIRIGLLVNRDFGQTNLFLRTGLSKTGEFNDYLFVPTAYMLIGFSYRF